MKKRKIRLNFKRIFLLLFLLIGLLGIYYIVFNQTILDDVNHKIQGFSENPISYDIIKIDDNPNYSGVRSESCFSKRRVHHNFYYWW